MKKDVKIRRWSAMRNLKRTRIFNVRLSEREYNIIYRLSYKKRVRPADVREKSAVKPHLVARDKIAVPASPPVVSFTRWKRARKFGILVIIMNERSNVLTGLPVVVRYKVRRFAKNRHITFFAALMALLASSVSCGHSEKK